MVIAMPVIVVVAVLFAVLLAVVFYVTFVLRLLGTIARGLPRLFRSSVSPPEPPTSNSAQVSVPAQTPSNPQP
jgi:hypothetical protein